MIPQKQAFQRTDRVASKLTHVKIQDTLIDSLFEQIDQSNN